MSNAPPPFIRMLRAGVLILAYAAVAAWCTNSFMEKWGFREDERRYNFIHMLDHTADRPFVFRVLVPGIVNEVSRLLGARVRENFAALESLRPSVRNRFFRAEGQIPWTAELSFKYHLTYFLLFISLLATMLVLRALTHSFFPHDPPLQDVAPLLFTIFLPLSFIAGGYFYDFPELFFLALAFTWAARRRYVMLALLLPVAVLNKESNLLIPILLLPILACTSRLRTTAQYVAALLGLGLATSMVVKWHFAANPGTSIEVHLWQNLDYWSHPTSYIKFSDFYAPLLPFPKGFNLILLTLLAGSLISRWSDMPIVIKRLLFVALLINIPLLLMFSAMDELRNLSMTFIPLYLGGCSTIKSWYSVPPACFTDPRQTS